MEEQDARVAGVEKRAHSAACEGSDSDDEAAACLEASYLSKGGRFPDGFADRNADGFAPPEDGPGCRALVPYRPRRSSLAHLPSYPRRIPPTRRPVGDIPHEIFPIVFQYMDAATLCSVASVSREWKRHSNDDRYWRRLCRARFNVTPDAFAPPPDPIKRLYQLQYGSLKAMYRGCGPVHRSAPPAVSVATSTQLLLGLLASNAI